MDSAWWRVAEVCFVSAFVAPAALVTAFCAGWWFRGLVFGWETSEYGGTEDEAAMDVERIRRAAVRRIELDRVGMVMSCRQVLALIERGDERVAAYETRIRGLERRIELLEEGGHHGDTEGTEEEEDELMPIDDVMELVGMTRSNLGRLANYGRVRAEKRPVVGADGITRQVWHLDLDEVMIWQGLSRAEKNLVGRGELSLERVNEWDSG